MAIVWIPGSLRGYCGGRREIRVPGATLRQVLANLEAECPGIREHICDDVGLLASVNVAIDGELTEQGLVTPVEPDSEIQILPALAGG